MDGQAWYKVNGGDPCFVCWLSVARNARWLASVQLPWLVPSLAWLAHKLALALSGWLAGERAS